jgi:hypothetical protein
VRSEQCNVLTDKLFRNVEQTVIANEPNPKRIIRHQKMMELLWAGIRMLLQKPVDMLPGFANQAGIEHVAKDGIAFALEMRFVGAWRLRGRSGHVFCLMNGHGVFAL